MNKSVLIITRDFTPYSRETGWIIRTVSLANFLKLHNFDVFVLATKRSTTNYSIKLRKGISTYWVYNGLHHALSSPIKIFHPSIITYFIKYIKHLIKDVYMYDYDHPLLSEYKKKISTIVESNVVSKIIVSTPPHSLLLLIPWIKCTYPSIEVVMDMRDAWSFRPMYRFKGKKQDSIKKNEANIINQADSCVYVTNGLRDLYVNTYGNHNSYVIENGYIDYESDEPAEEMFVSKIQELKIKKKLVIGFFGSGSIGYPRKHKELTPIIEAINGDPELRNKIHLILQGTIKIKSGKNNYSSVTILPSSNNSIIHKHMSLVDVGLSIFNDPPDYSVAGIGGKTYDYIRAGIPILGISDPNSISLIELINEVGGVHANIRNTIEIQTQLHYLLECFNKHESLTHLVKVRDIKKYSRSFTYEKYLRVLDETT